MTHLLPRLRRSRYGLALLAASLLPDPLGTGHQGGHFAAYQFGATKLGHRLFSTWDVLSSLFLMVTTVCAPSLFL